MRHIQIAVGALCLAPSVMAQEQGRVDPPRIDSVSRDAFVRFRAAAWLTNADGSFSSGEAIGGVPSNIDLEDTLGLDTDQTVVWATLGFNLGAQRRWHLDLSYTGHFEYDGTSGPVEFAFEDRVFTGAVESRAELDIYEVSLRYDLFREDAFTFSIGPGVRMFDFEASVEGAASDGTTPPMQRREEISAFVPLPGLGAGVRFDITENFFIRTSGSGIYAGEYGNFLDAAAEIGWDIFTNFGIFGGYRWIHAEADYRDVEFEVDLRGPYMGAELRF